VKVDITTLDADKEPKEEAIKQRYREEKLLKVTQVKDDEGVLLHVYLA
jgi:hypothetical protein